MIDSNVEHIEALRAQGLSYIQKNRLAEAKAVFEQISSINVRDADAWIMLSSICGLLGDIEETGNCCRRVIELQPENGEAYLNLGNVFFSQGKYHEAETHYKMAICFNPNHALALCSLGNALTSLGRYEEAETNYQAAIQIDPNLIIAFFNFGNLRMRQGLYDKAENNYRRAIQLNPDYAPAYNNLGNLLWKQGNVQDAMECYQHAVKLNSSLFEAYNNIGIILSELKRYDEALASYDQAISLKLDYAEAYCNRGNALHHLKRYEDALISYDKAISLKPDYIEAYRHRASALGFLGRMEEAVTSLRHVVSIAPDDADGHHKLGMALEYYGKTEEAVESFQQALKIQPDFVQALNGLGNSLRRLGRLEEAKGCFDRSLKLKPDAKTFFDMHPLLIDTDNMSPAIECLKTAVNLDPKDIDYKFYLGMLLEYAGCTESADIYFKEVQQGSNSQKADLDAWNYIKSANKGMPRMIGSSIEAFRLGIDAAPQSGLVLEFGVRFGMSIRQIASLVTQEIYGFDSFEGLPESWHAEDKGSYTTNEVIPDVPDNVHLYKGWFENTLPEFVKTHKDPIRFMNIDCDIYSSTKTVLDCLSSQIVPGTIIAFDEYIGNEHWREDEFKAFHEAVEAYGWKYQYLAFSFFTKQVIIQLL